MNPIRGRAELARAIRRAEYQGARLAAGATFGSRTEREQCGELLLQLADVARRAFDPAAELPRAEDVA